MKFNFTKKLFFNVLFATSSILFFTSCNNDDDDKELIEQQKYETLDLSTFDLSNGLPTAGGKIWEGTYKEDAELAVGIFKLKHTAWPEYLTWMGFTVSNSNDNSDQINKEGGWLENQWGTMPKGGANGVGSPFLVSFADHKPSDKVLKYGEEVKIDRFSSVVEITDSSKKYKTKSVKLAISPWSYYGILNGDAYARKFEKGDYFAIHIYGVSENKQLTTEKPVTHYFVDFRNGVNTISTNWQDVDLSPLGEVKYVLFFLETTDVGQWGANTALYFTMDKLKVEKIQ
ncbi:DUF4465 domain-containing protein [Empedobacter brevis]|uniref:DUF4465 domain-containing protein n=1 Tax=Empedobacter brevis TaxID=247 RepID=A0AAJ1QI19_9FLAO|nr:DUF4465 domain-containing protein [Empedobacter brevis]MDM1074306.1 DUF4465 domain-containing protein [Empedobacter brevis]QHC83847.1 hypothetical protein AS589_03095 [Empedobacter brevis]